MPVSCSWSWCSFHALSKLMSNALFVFKSLVLSLLHCMVVGFKAFWRVFDHECVSEVFCCWSWEVCSLFVSFFTFLFQSIFLGLFWNFFGQVKVSISSLLLRTLFWRTWHCCVVFIVLFLLLDSNNFFSSSRRWTILIPFWMINVVINSFPSLWSEVKHMKLVDLLCDVNNTSEQD